MTDLSDLSKIDFDCVQRLKRIRALGTKVEPDPGSTSRGGEEKKSRGANDDAATLSEAAESEFTAVWEGLAFNTRRSDSSLVDLIPGGSDIPVSYQRRNEYADAVEKYRLHEFDQQFAAIRRGFGTIVPLRLMPLFTWQEAEVLVCGTPEINIAALKMHTVYQGFSGADDPTVKTFWTIMEEWGQRGALQVHSIRMGPPALAAAGGVDAKYETIAAWRRWQPDACQSHLFLPRRDAPVYFPGASAQNARVDS